MLTTEEAFAKFRTRMELTEREQTDASRRQLEIREHMSATFAIDEDFLTGSYKRHTKTKPLKDVDIFCVLGDEEGHYRDEPPAVLLGDVEEALIEKYGREAVSRQRRSVSVDFGVQVVDDDSAEHVLSFDVVPAFGDGDGYEIPDVGCAIGWTKTNPRVHAEMATASHHA